MTGLVPHIAVVLAVAVPTAALLVLPEGSRYGAVETSVESKSSANSLPVWQIGKPDGASCALSSSPSQRLSTLQLSQTCRVAMPELEHAVSWQRMAGGDIVVMSASRKVLVSFSESGEGMWEANWPTLSSLQLVAPSR